MRTKSNGCRQRILCFSFPAFGHGRGGGVIHVGLAAGKLHVYALKLRILGIVERAGYVGSVVTQHASSIQGV